MALRGPDASHRIVVLQRKDSFLRVEWSQRLRAALEAAHGRVEEFQFDGASTPLAVVLDELRSYGLMAVHKLVIVDNADAFFAAEERRRAMERYAAEPMQEATLLLRAHAWRPGNFDKLVGEIGLVLKCEPPGDADAIRWCVGRCPKQHGLPIAVEAAELLVERVGSDLARLDSELGKLAVAALSAKADRIDRPLVKEMVGSSREEQAWEVQGALLSGSAGDVSQKVCDLIRISKAPEVMLSWAVIDLVRKVHAAAVLAADGHPDGQIAREIKLWGESTAPVLRAARRVGVARSAALLHDAIRADFCMKSGGAPDPERALLGICSRVADEFRGS